MIWLNAESADVFKWVGPDGRTYYGDQPTDNTAKRVERANAIGPVPLSEVEIEESTFKYFPISGSTPRELHESMLANGPFNQIAQRRVIGECGWNIKSTVEYERKAGQCGIGKFKVTLMTEITMPKWMNADTASADVRRLWTQVESDIRKHENTHKTIHIEAANVLARRMRALPPYDNCRALDVAIVQQRMKVFTEYAISDRAFDRVEAAKAGQKGRLIQ